MDDAMLKRIIEWVDSPIADLRYAVGKDDADVKNMTKGELVGWLVEHYQGEEE